MLEIILFIIIFILVLLVLVEGIIIRGFLKTDKIDSEYKPAALTGREIEAIRRKLESIGMNAISRADVANLIRTFQLIVLGVYEDKDPYVPADPYEDIPQ